jgi:hypothetical protein
MDGAYGYLMPFTGDPDRYQQAQPGDRTDDLRTERVPQRGWLACSGSGPIVHGYLGYHPDSWSNEELRW